MTNTMDFEWTEAVGNIVSSIYEQKIKEPQITAMLSPWNDMKDMDVIFIKMARDFAVNCEELAYLADNLSSLSKAEVLLYKLMYHKENADYGIVANIILKTLDAELNYTQVNNLLYKVREFHDKTGVYNMDAVDYLLSLRGEKKYAPVPKWVSINEGENLSLLQTVSPGQSYEQSKVKNEQYIAQVHDIFHEIDQGQIKGTGNKLTLETAFNSVLSSYSDAENIEETSATRVLGPMNRFIDRDCISNPNTMGPCRMLECLCREVMEEPEGGIIERKYFNWFNGKCQNCLLKIRDPSHALRFPEKEGGWSGCYCSLACLKEDIRYIDESINIRLDNMMLILRDTGIMDRSKV